MNLVPAPQHQDQREIQLGILRVVHHNNRPKNPRDRLRDDPPIDQREIQLDPPPTAPLISQAAIRRVVPPILPRGILRTDLPTDQRERLQPGFQPRIQLVGIEFPVTSRHTRNL